MEIDKIHAKCPPECPMCFKIYKLNLFETLKSFISCTIETHTEYQFIDLNYGSTRNCVPFDQLKHIEKSEEWEEILSSLAKQKIMKLQSRISIGGK